MENQHRIYLIECIQTGKVYVGSASFIVQRLSRHRRDLRAGKHGNPILQAAWAKYGEAAFQFSELECVLEQRWLVAAEQRWIDGLAPEFNIARTAGSPLGVRHSVETRAKRSAALKAYWDGRVRQLSPETRQRISDAQRGKTRIFTDAHRAALSASASGRALSEEAKAKIRAAHLGRKKVFTPAHKANIKAAWAARKERNGSAT